jgi:hypothetical protein
MLSAERLEQMQNQPLNNEEFGHQGGRRGRKKRPNGNSGAPVSFRWPWELDARLDNYRADRKRKEHRVIERTEVVIEALEEFLTKEGYPPPSKNS